MSSPRRRDVLTTAAVVVAVGSAGCADTGQQTDEEDEPSDEASDETQENDDGQGTLRVAHLSPDAPNVDVSVDGEAVIEDLSFGEVSPYAALDPGSYQVAVTAAEDEDTVVFNEEIELEAQEARTAVAFGEAAGGPDTGFGIELLDDDLTDPGEGTSRIRLFHAVPDAGEVDIVVRDAPEAEGDDQTDMPQQDEPLFEAVEFGETVSETVPAGDYTLEVVPTDGEDGSTNESNTTDDDTMTQTENATDDENTNTTQGGNTTSEQEGEEADTPATEFDLEADGETVYTAFAIGYLDPEAVGSEDEFEVVTVVDASEGERADGGTDSAALFRPTA